jgi:hypothetical protein
MKPNELSYYIIVFTTPDRGLDRPHRVIISARSPEAAHETARVYCRDHPDNRLGGGGALLDVRPYPAA